MKHPLPKGGYIAVTALLIFAAIGTGCRKEEAPLSIENSVATAKKDTLVRFLSFTLNVPESSIAFNATTQEFHTLTGKVYFREGNVIRHILNNEVKERYHFNFNSIINVTSISGYTLGEVLD